MLFRSIDGAWSHYDPSSEAAHISVPIESKVGAIAMGTAIHPAASVLDLAIGVVSCALTNEKPVLGFNRKPVCYHLAMSPVPTVLANISLPCVVHLYASPMSLPLSEVSGVGVTIGNIEHTLALLQCD